ncbi:MAG TPA: Calx-beta domain-containing protein [Pyrinomonadaceae bacterium]|nr:Calx-beta domain-containing protein [Pyrinomonadaceae bacterium]HLE62882.1 Calx-beta domain-containing protein [Pyrinomonadaceae bacterium]
MDFLDTVYSVPENSGSVLITVVRSGDASVAATVQYATQDGTASHLSDYNLEWGTIRFAGGQTSKTFLVFVTDDGYVENNETIALKLTNPSGGTPFLGSRTEAVLTIGDNDSITPATNIIDNERFFVRQQYVDFLNREPDDGGLDYWSGQIAQCGANLNCLSRRRADVSAAFFVEQEFQQAGYFVYRLILTSTGHQPVYPQYIRGRTEVIAGTDLGSSQLAYAEEVVNPAYNGLSNEGYVDELFTNASITPSPSERTALIVGLNGTPPTETRASVLIKIANHDTLVQREYNAAFVLAQYFNYLQRDPDVGGYDFWLNVLNNREPNNYSGMVCAFITSDEYQRRFASVISRTNGNCGP